MRHDGAGPVRVCDGRVRCHGDGLECVRHGLQGDLLVAGSNHVGGGLHLGGDGAVAGERGQAARDDGEAAGDGGGVVALGDLGDGGHRDGLEFLVAEDAGEVLKVVEIGEGGRVVLVFVELDVALLRLAGGLVVVRLGRVQFFQGTGPGMEEATGSRQNLPGDLVAFWFNGDTEAGSQGAVVC